jgi:hypothetical protein
VDVETAIDVIFAPVLMLLIWRYSLGACGCGGHDPATLSATPTLILALQGLAVPAKVQPMKRWTSPIIARRVGACCLQRRRRPKQRRQPAAKPALSVSCRPAENPGLAADAYCRW